MQGTSFYLKATMPIPMPTRRSSKRSQTPKQLPISSGLEILPVRACDSL